MNAALAVLPKYKHCTYSQQNNWHIWKDWNQLHTKRIIHKKEFFFEKLTIELFDEAIFTYNTCNYMVDTCLQIVYRIYF